MSKYFKFFCSLFFFALFSVNAQDFDRLRLVETLPEGSRVLRRKIDVKFGYTELTFVNGVQIILKPTDFNNDRILFAGFSPGGSSLYLVEDFLTATVAANIATMSGIGNFDGLALESKLSDNTASLLPYISEMYEGVNGSATPDDLETMLQLNYLYFTATRYDETAFNTVISQLRNQTANMRNDPLYAYLNALNISVTNNNPRSVVIPDENQIDRIRHINALNIFNDRFSDASDFKFVMVGNFDVNSITPLLETYLGGLPSRRRIETWRDVTTPFPFGIRLVNHQQNTDNQSRVDIIMKGGFRWNIRERIQFALFTEIFNFILCEAAQGKAHDINVTGNASRYPNPKYSLEIVFNCAPDIADSLIFVVFEEAKKLKANGPNAIELNQLKETLISQRESEMTENQYWLSVLLNTYQHGDRLMTFEEYKRLVNSVRPRDIRRIARQYFNENNYVIGKFTHN